MLPQGVELDRITQHVRVDSGDGQVKNIWLKGKAKDLPNPKEMAQAISDAIHATLKPRKRIKKPRTVANDLMLNIPLGDAHIGLYAHHSDAGGDFDLSIAYDYIVGAAKYLIDESEPSEIFFLEILGDYFHANDLTNETPKSKHRLDVDSRRFKVICAGIRILTDIIDYGAEKHKSVYITIVPGNHDPDATQWLMATLIAHYRNNLRITVNESQQAMPWFRFGNTIIGTTHGDKIKFNSMAKTLAVDCPHWSECEYRYVHSGHVHSNNKKDDMECEAESFRIMAPGDHYAQSNAYRTKSEMQSITYHKEYGERTRNRAPLQLVRDLL